mgnify:CR=1 FL=1
MKDMELKRINIRIPAYIQDYYKAQGEKYSVPYTNYIAMVLTQIYEKEEERQLVQEFNQTMKQMKEMAGNVTAEEMNNQLQQIKDIISKLENN